MPLGIVLFIVMSKTDQQKIALLHCLGNRTHAANILGISIRTLRNKLKQYGSEGFNIPSPGDASQAGA